MTPVSSHAPHGQSSLRTVQVLGGGNAAGGAHVRSLAAGLVARGVRVTVCAPEEADRAYGFTGVGAEHVPVPRSSDPGSVAALRAACSGADLVHAHGLHASFRTSMALSGRSTPFVVTWHDRAHAEGPAPTSCACWSGGSYARPPWSSARLPSWWTGPAAAGRVTPGSPRSPCPGPAARRRPRRPSGARRRCGPNSAPWTGR